MPVLDADAVIDGDFTPSREDIAETAERALAIRDNGAIWTPTFAQSVDAAIEFQQQKQRFMQHVLKEGTHYMTLPGASKPSLLKPGAEALNAAMGLHPILTDAEAPTLDLLGQMFGEPYIRYRKVCGIFRQVGLKIEQRMLVAQADGLCNSWEVKYRYREDKLKCPACGKNTIIKAKDFSGQNRKMGWVCWFKEGKSDGCGVKYGPGDKEISEQVTGKVPNPDISELENTICKMAGKRALIAATLIATGCSDIFTQDLEDMGGRGGDEDEPPEAPPADEKPKRTRTTVAKPNPADAIPPDFPKPDDPPPQSARKQVATDSTMAKADAKRNLYTGRLTELEEKLSMSATERRTVRQRVAKVDTKNEMTIAQMEKYGSTLNGMLKALDEYYGSVDVAQREMEQAERRAAMAADPEQ